MTLPYDFEIISVDKQSRVMEVRYTSPGMPTQHICARLPYAGESLDAVVAMYAPVAYWLEQSSTVQDVAVGTKGSFRPPAPPDTGSLAYKKKAKLEEIANWRYARETGGLTFRGALIATDRESQAAISNVLASMQNGFLESVEWKAGNNQWVTLGINDFKELAHAVAQHVQSAFSTERQLAQQVAVATTVEAVDGIVVPWQTASATIPVSVL